MPKVLGGCAEGGGSCPEVLGGCAEAGGGCGEGAWRLWLKIVLKVVEVVTKVKEVLLKCFKLS